MALQDGTIGITLKGDAKPLLEALAQGGKATEDFGKKTQQTLDKTTDSAKQLHDTLRQVGGQIGAAITINWGVNKVLEFRSAIQQAQVDIDKLRNTITYGLGSYNVAQEVEYLRATTNKLGLEFVSTSQLYGRLAAAARGTALEGQGVKTVFEAVGKASTVMGLSAADVQGVMLALTQIMSKGTVQSEEIRGQLGERLPGAFQIASRAMGVTTAEFGKLLETGQVLSVDFLPKFAAQLDKELSGSFEKAAQSAQASLNRLTSAWEQFKIAIADDAGVGAAIARVNNALSASLNTWTLNLRAAAQSQGFGQVFLSLVHNAASLTDEIKTSQKQLAELESRLASQPSNIYAQSAAADMRAYIKELQTALDTQNRLSGKSTGDQGPGNVGAIAAQFPSRSQSYQIEEERLNKIRKDMGAVVADIAGQKAHFYQHLAALKAGYDAGIMNHADYVANVTKLIEKEGVEHKKGSDHIKTIHDARYALAKATQAQITALNDVSIAEQQRVNDLLYRGGSIDVETYHRRKAELEIQAIDRKRSMLQADLAEAEQAAKGLKKEEDKLRAQERIVKVQTQLIELGKERAKVDGPDDAAVRAWQRLNEAVSAEDKAMASLNKGLYDHAKSQREATEDAAIALRYQFDSLGGLDKELALIELKYTREKEILRVKLMQSDLADEEKEKIRAQLDAYTQVQRKQAEGNYILGILNSIEGTAHSVWTNVLQGGQDTFKRIGNTIKSAVLDLLYQLTIKKWIISIGASITGSMASAGTSGTSGIMGSLGGIGNLLGGVGAFGSYATTGIMNSIAGGAGMFGNLSSGLSAAGALFEGGSIMGGLGMGLGTVAPYLAAIAVASQLFSSKGGPKVEGGYSNIPGLQPGTNGRAYVNGAYGGENDAAAKTIVQTLGSTYSSMLASLGVKAGAALTAQAFLDSDPRGNSGNALDFQAALGGKVIYNRFAALGTNRAGSTDAEAQAAAQLASTTALVEALKATDLGKALNAYMATVVTEGKSLEELNAVLSEVQAIGTFKAALQGLPFEALSALSVEATQSLIAAVGGLDQLKSAVSSYYQNFYTDAERNAITTEQMRQSLAAVNLQLPATREAFRALVDAQDLTTEAGRAAYAALMSVASAFAGVVPAATSAATSTTASTTSTTTAEQARTKVLNDAKAALQASVGAERTRLQAIVSAATESKNALQELFDLLAQNVRDLYQQVDATRAASASAGRAYISNAVSVAMATGYLPETAALSDAIAAARAGLDASAYGSKFAYDRDRLRLAAELSYLNGKTGQQLTVAEQALSAANEQVRQLDELLQTQTDLIDAALGTKIAVLSVVDAVANVEAAITGKGRTDTNTAQKQVGGFVVDAGSATFGLNAVAPSAGFGPVDLGGLNADQYGKSVRGILAALGGAPSYDVGTNYVPRDMLAQIHQGEAIIPRAYNPAAGGGVPGLSGVAGDLRAQREDARAQSAASVAVLTQIRRLFEQWDKDGMPGVRA